MGRWLRRLALLGPVALVVASVAQAGGGARYLTSPRSTVAVDPPAQSVSRHVILVSIDGLRPDAIAAFDAPTLRKLTREGSFTLRASTITPSTTLPAHTSMLTGVPPERHGVLWNDVLHAPSDHIDQPTVFGVARGSGYVTAAFFSKPKFHPLQQANALDYTEAPGGWWGSWPSSRTAADVEKYLRASRPNLLFVHLADPDRAGHASGWMSDAYGRAVRDTDASLARLLSACDRAFGKGEYTVIVTADHGGHDRDHGSADPRDVTIPWIVWGRGVKATELRGVSIRTMDTASTILWLLGLDEPADWSGRPVTDAFVAVAALH